ncbi:hypothetical protein NEHOM01_2464 [Nematocida homosporus]|uniref:uncharacterized protein n=1 Tax=Nematocida homosporus TaxID=1912981 RepID=UPI002220D39E|nr:uncharacterized protein NEHOM01_2464 [Nematocida homosporus]KAI5187949.1 hypothetical protein NEHOM01_2464 [Nematocida homosporus]
MKAIASLDYLCYLQSQPFVLISLVPMPWASRYEHKMLLFVIFELIASVGSTSHSLNCRMWALVLVCVHLNILLVISAIMPMLYFSILSFNIKTRMRAWAKRQIGSSMMARSVTLMPDFNADKMRLVNDSSLVESPWLKQKLLSISTA